LWIDDGCLRMDGVPREVVRSYMTIFSDQQTSPDLSSLRRRGSGEIRFSGIDFISGGTDGPSVVRTGDRLVIRLRYRATSPVPHPSVGFRLYTDTGTMVTSTSTWLHGIKIPVIPTGDGHIDIDIPNLNLVQARYNISLWISDGPQGSHVYDALDHCARLTVEPSALATASKEINSAHGIVYFPQTWDLSGISHGVELVPPA
jgi:lipopolysaccharide transport system ATP-binding protein